MFLDAGDPGRARAEKVMEELEEMEKLEKKTAVVGTSYFCMGAPGSSREPETPWELPGEGSELPGAPKTGVWETPGALELPGDPSGDPLSGLELPGDPLSRGLQGVSAELHYQLRRNPHSIKGERA